MKPFTRLDARAAPLPLANIDTDQIIPKQFLKTVEREGLSRGLFYDLRFDDAGKPRPDFVLNRPEYAGAGVLVTGDNFGCGSSREHAPQALMRWGIRAVVGESFAEIFHGNCLALGIPCLVAGHDQMLAIQAAATAAPAEGFRLEVAGACLSGAGQHWELELAAGPRQMLASGQWDATGQLVANAEALQATVQRLPYLQGFTSL